MDRREFVKISSTGIAATASSHNPLMAALSQEPADAKNYQIGAYFAPIWHPDPWSEKIHGKGWTEWELVKRAEPKYPGHQQPKVPLWGYEDESDPAVMAKKIDAAADHGINHFIMDWYWYEDIGPFQNRALDIGYMQAENNSRLKFCLMWANHPRVDYHPVKRDLTIKRYCHGAVDRKTFDKLTDHVIANYFLHPQYWKIEGRPYFSIYMPVTMFVEGLGGVDQAAAALQEFREKVKAAGLPGLHLNCNASEPDIAIGTEAVPDPDVYVAKLNFDSVSSYIWGQSGATLKEFPTVQYEPYAKEAERQWHRLTKQFSVPYYPNVDMGWDSSPRAVQSDVYGNLGYPFMPMIEGNTPAAFKVVLERMKDFLDSTHDEPRIFNINSWNEWVEGSYLEPDTVNGMGYLEAIRDVFGASSH